jgi:hypothetical protein
LDDNRCLFCNELESVSHLFFKCCVVRLVWSEIAEISGKEIGTYFESVATLWVADKKYKVLNVCSAAALWAIWKLRNEFCFKGAIWSGVQMLLRKITRMVRDWRLLNKPEASATLEVWAQELESRSCRLPRLGWTQESEARSVVGLTNSASSKISLFCNDSQVVNCIGQDTSHVAVPDEAFGAVIVN